MSRINRYEADWPILRHLMPRGRSMPMGSSILRKSSMARKSNIRKIILQEGGGLLYLILKRFACVNKYIIERQKELGAAVLVCLYSTALRTRLAHVQFKDFLLTHIWHLFSYVLIDACINRHHTTNKYYI